MNMSFGRGLQDIIEDTDGNSHLTQFVDWSARRHDILYAVAWGNIVDPDKRTPTDNYNGITVAASEQIEPPFGDVYRKFGSINHTQGDAAGDRTSIGLLAPGALVPILGPGDMEILDADGTSVATPHVTGAVALLQQFVQQQIDASNPRFNSNSQRHEVMKAVMLNSADKLAGVHGSGRTILDSNDQDWTESEAYVNQDIPLDDEMGAGHLNVARSVQQLASGEYNPSDMIPLIGWDFGTLGGGGSSLEYTFGQSLGASQYIAITLAWDRRIESTGGTTYGQGDTFTTHGVANLDLQLMTAGGMVVAQSNSADMNLEHVFFNVQDAGDYKIRVVHSPGDIGNPLATTNFGLAWWFGNPAAPVPGDYNGNGSVGPEDYDLWKSNFGSTIQLAADGNGDGTVNAADYTIWRNNLGAGAGSGSLASVPEPSAMTLFAIASVVAALRRSRNWSQLSSARRCRR